MLGIIKRNFKHLTIQSFTMLYKNMVRSHLDIVLLCGHHIWRRSLRL